MLFVILLGDYSFVVINAKDDDPESKSMLQVNSSPFMCISIILFNYFRYLVCTTSVSECSLNIDGVAGGIEHI